MGEKEGREEEKSGWQGNFFNDGNNPPFSLLLPYFPLHLGEKRAITGGNSTLFAKIKTRAFCSFVQKSFFAKEFANSPLLGNSIVGLSLGGEKKFSLYAKKSEEERPSCAEKDGDSTSIFS